MAANFDLSGRVALVTGSGQGIGEALARGLAEAGARVILQGRSRDKVAATRAALTAQGLAVDDVIFDVTDELAGIEALDGIVKRHGALDILINNAGIIRRAPLEHLSAEDFRAVIETDLTAPFLLARAAARHMIPRRAGKIVNVCSLMSQITRETVGAYAAAKGGLKQLTLNMATEWGRHNIQVNGIGPGFIATPLNAVYREPGTRLSDYIISRTPARRWGTPDDLIGAAVFLCSPAADFVNGHILYVDGGLLACLGDPDALPAP